MIRKNKLYKYSRCIGKRGTERAYQHVQQLCRDNSDFVRWHIGEGENDNSQLVFCGKSIYFDLQYYWSTPDAVGGGRAGCILMF